jgi:hypothetical protein
VINKILTHLDAKDASTEPARLRPSRGPPQAGLFDGTTTHPYERLRPGWRGAAALGLTVRIRPKSPSPAEHFPAREAKITADIAAQAG